MMLVHGERQKMEFLKARIESELGLPCFDPANGATAYITTHHKVTHNLTPYPLLPTRCPPRP